MAKVEKEKKVEVPEVAKPEELAALSHERDVEKDYEMKRVRRDAQGAWVWEKVKKQ